ncbi:MAG: glycosylhydrolase-like jelly roll fold domain-containing protein [Sediminibacterium sp.]
MRSEDSAILFDTKWGGPAKIQTDVLKSWTEFSDPGIRYYSGQAVYKNSFIVDAKDLKENIVTLDLGNVLEMASIKINGYQMAVRWSSPFAFDMTKYLKTGTNQLEVEVVNLWPNRLIGDSKLPKEKRLTQTNILKYEDKDSEKLLRISGMLGPVQLRFVHTEIK